MMRFGVGQIVASGRGARRALWAGVGAGLMAAVLPPGTALAQTGSAASQGQPFVPAKIAGGLCTTHVSPAFPLEVPQESTAVTLRVSISRAGRLTPLYRVSGPPQFELEAMNAARLWKCTPYTRPTSPTTSEPIDILTEITVPFTAGQPAGFVTHTPR